jgi:LAO/AO transport system kinase
VNALLEGLLNGDARALARIITRVENRSADCTEILQALFPHTGQARIIGVTGSPGAGKSTLVDRLTAAYRRLNKTLGIVAVDPTSPFSGGAILGDRIRMQSAGTDPGVFIRSMATRGQLGGLAAATADVVAVLDAAHRDPVIVETVGVGQDEIDIIKLADVSILVLVPGMGDDIQALKAGIMEIADVFVINKSDRPGVEKLERALNGMLSLAHREDGWMPPIVKTIAIEGTGVDELVTEIDRCVEYFRSGTIQTRRRRDAARQRLLAVLGEKLMNEARSRVLPDQLEEIVLGIAERRKDPYSAAEEIVKGLLR